MSVTDYRDSEPRTCYVCGVAAPWRVQPGGARDIGVLYACRPHLNDAIGSVCGGKPVDREITKCR